jgi:hypothetical protein
VHDGSTIETNGFDRALPWRGTPAQRNRPDALTGSQAEDRTILNILLARDRQLCPGGEARDVLYLADQVAEQIDGVRT